MRILFLILALTFTAKAEVVTFTIKAGTHGQPWTPKEQPIRAKVGDTLKIVNDDDVTHRMHTNDDAPCEHSPEIKAGTSWECKLINPYDSFAENEGPLWDHEFGFSSEAKVWIVVEDPTPARKLTAAQDITLEAGSIRTFVTDRQKVERAMPFINVDCAIVHSASGTDRVIPKGSVFKVKKTSEPEFLDLANISPSDIAEEYEFQWGEYSPELTAEEFQKAMSVEYGKFYGMDMNVTEIERVYIKLESSAPSLVESLIVKCENKINHFEVNDMWDVFDTSDYFTAK